MKIDSIKATGKWVIIKAVEVEEKQQLVTTPGGIILPDGSRSTKGQNVNSSEGKKTVDLYVEDIGPDVKDVNYKVGDCVLCDAYDLQTIEDDNHNMYGICDCTKVKAVLKVSRS